ncbi:hypothetical protein [Schinkia azotoformans]|uniref:hypothetical protein n=1 Tax=Schinkia azotoformans TaxID=1454 RepID=UPI002DB774AA|nr:hypothetical protein [Schinkia azotoformans]MEC1695656.1 hypothetical protein [Schinkia azotoformans]MEC1726526.1 hypothetical protein [Schinkia azotoformans]MEC1782190.1 hypothetical protein [Schinkia azotoformans]MED4331918.1 hypothetical protein [Schinkia azotoformans]
MNYYYEILIGAVFMLISSILISAQFIAASIFSINRKSFSPGAIYYVFNSAGYLLVILSICFFIVGLIFILTGLKNKK